MREPDAMQNALSQNMTFNNAIKGLTPLLLLLAILVGFAFCYRLLGLPESDDLLTVATTYLGRYGYLIVFIAAFIETIPPINFYFPGSAVVVFSVAYARRGELDVFAVLAVANSAFLAAYALDYALGRFGWYQLLEKCGFKPSLERVRGKVERHGLKWLWLACVHPNLCSLAATSCGILHTAFVPFMLQLLIAQTVWTIIWGAAAYFGADVVFSLANAKWLILIVAVLILFKIIKNIRSKP